MSESPLATSPYAVLGVAVTATTEEIRRAYRRKLRETHPDTGGAPAQFHAVQRAWELIGTPEARTHFDRGGGKVWDLGEHSGPVWAPTPPAKRADSRPQSRAHGHPGGWYREQYLELLHEWVGRGVAVPDPYDATLIRSAPREIRHLLASAVAEEETARQLATLGIGFTVWHDVETTAHGSVARSDIGKLDHIVLGPTGLWAILSEDWGEPVKTRRGELIGPALSAGERPLHELADRARSFARAAKVKVSALVIVVPDNGIPDGVPGVEKLGSIRGATTLLVQRSRLPNLLRSGVPGVGVGGTDLFELRTRVQNAARFV